MTTYFDECSVGCDPEFFLKDKITGNFVSAHDLIPGDKHNPYRLTHGAVQADGVAVEFNIDPAHSWEDFHRNIRQTLIDIRSMIPSKYSFEFVPCAYFNEDYFEKEVPKYAKVLGCEPDRDAYSEGKEVVIANKQDAEDKPFRTSGGHIHIGWCKDADTQDKAHLIDCSLLVEKMDETYEGLYKSFCSFEEENIRSSLYGYRGAFRAKTYGCEYRTPSSSWVKNERTWYFMFQLAKVSFDFTKKGENVFYIPALSHYTAHSKDYFFNVFFESNGVERPKIKSGSIRKNLLPFI